MSTAIAAFQPNVTTMNDVSQPQAFATIRTGGAAYAVMTPPIDTFTNSTARPKYFTLLDTSAANSRSRSRRAASVIAAGSVISEPSKGMAQNASQIAETSVRSGTSAEAR